MDERLPAAGSRRKHPRARVLETLNDRRFTASVCPHNHSEWRIKLDDLSQHQHNSTPYVHDCLGCPGRVHGLFSSYTYNDMMYEQEPHRSIHCYWKEGKIHSGKLRKLRLCKALAINKTRTLNTKVARRSKIFATLRIRGCFKKADNNRDCINTLISSIGRYMYLIPPPLD